MKRLILLFVGVIVMPSAFAQDISDAVRYANDNLQGTARFRSMSGAFGALGGDMSAISINPAGAAIFTRSHASISISNFDIENNTEYFGNRNITTESNIDFNQAGGVFVFRNNNQNTKWRKAVLGLSYHQTANFDNDFFASGTNTNSIDSYFLANAQGLRLDQISAFPGESITDAYGDIGASFGYVHQQAFLGFESFILEPDDINDDANTTYFSNIAPGTFNQEYSLASTGYNGKFTVNLAAQYEEDFFIGANLNSHFINYRRSTYLYEGNDNSGSFVNEVGFENNLFVDGTGFSFQIGGIAKLTESFRVGFTYDSPTWYRINEETTQFLGTTVDVSGNASSIILDPQIVNIFPEYRLQTPAKLTGSAAIIFGQRGLLSFDYSRKDFGNTKFRPTTDSFFAIQNEIISQNLKVANSYRIGGELRHKQFSFRGGYRLEDSPYADETFYGDLTGYSLGIGYSFGNMKLDVAYENTEQTIGHRLFDIGLTDAASIDRNNTDLVFTLSFSL